MKISIEDILALEVQISALAMEQSKQAAKLSQLSERLVHMLGENGIDIFDTGEPTSAYVNQDR